MLLAVISGLFIAVGSYLNITGKDEDLKVFYPAGITIMCEYLIIGNRIQGLYPLQLSLVIESYVKILVRRVLSDRYRITQE